jgi:ATP-dependent Lhr-like helicase
MPIPDLENALVVAPELADHALDGFHPPVREWFRETFPSPTRPQALGWPLLQTGASTLILSPTGSGKTLTAFLSAIDRLMFEPVPPKAQRCRVLYVSPLKALAVDVERNLRAPLAGVARQAERMGIAAHTPEVFIRTGDTPSRDRAAFNRAPADILITTPESLYLMLTSQAREAFRSLECVIIDEIHAMVSTKRGAHLALSLERLADLTERPFQRIGLSATQRPLDEVARFLVGSEQGEYRPIHIVDAGQSKQLDILVEIPVEDMARLGNAAVPPSQIQRGHRALYHSPGGDRDQIENPKSTIQNTNSIWPAIHPLILDLIHAHTSTLIFVNSRRLAERMASALNELAGEEIVHAHHGSVAREQRQLIEEELKSGRLPAMVATSTLELGIDMGSIDLVIQVEAPPSVASGLQRIGRAGHQIGVPSQGVILPKFRGDLLACAALTDRMVHGQVEPLKYPRNPLDILAQQIVAMVSMDDWHVDDLDRLVRQAAPFRELPRSMLESTLDMLSGRYPSDAFAELRPRITWDRIENMLTSREGARRIAISSGGTIPDRGLYGVFLAGADGKASARVGELDEEMVFESRVGDVFLLGASSWRIEEITHDRVLVSPAPGQPGRMPFWHGERAGRPLEFGRAIGALTRTLRGMDEEEAMALLTTRHFLAEASARNLLQYLEDQAAAAGAIPDDRTIVVESNMDEMGDWRVCILSPFGSRVHAPWAMAIGAQVRERTGANPDILWTDDGIVVRLPETDTPPPADLFIPDPDEVEDIVIRQLGIGGGGAHETHFGAPVNALFASRFRENAARALLLPRKAPGRRTPLWQQRKRAADLLGAIQNLQGKYGSFPIILETFRECLQDVFDMPALTGLLRDIRSRDIHLAAVTTRSPSPFAASLLFNYVANFMYEGDAPLAERRAQALLVDPSQLRELLGEAELRELLDPGSLESVELTLQHLTPDRAARHPDALHDLFLRLGDMTAGEVAVRCDGDSAAWLTQLQRDHRIVALSIAGEPRFVAVEDAARYRDALGAALPPGLPASLLEEVPDALDELISRYGRTHGPFTAAEPAARFGTGVAPILTVLGKMTETGRVVEGEFRPGGTGKEWCDSGVLRALRQKSLARLRHEVEPVDQSALARLYLDWQNVRTDSRITHHASLLDVIQQLQDASIPASVLESQALPARLESYDPRELDSLTASGEVIWIGCESLGQYDGRISLYLADHAALLWTPPASGPTGDLHNGIRKHLANRGASFFPQIVMGVGGFPSEVLEALWDLVWADEVTNDTLQPLRALVDPPRTHSRERELRARRAPIVVRGRAARPSVVGPSRSTPPEAVGRWSLVSSLLYDEPTPTERSTARVQQLLDRLGIVTREAAQAAGFDGGFTTAYGILKAMEEAGRVRRGYFVSGLGATQFALPGAADRLRALRDPAAEPESILLAATDPANPYGTALPWPERPEGRRPMRMAGAHVILMDGYLVAWVAKGGRQLLTFTENIGERNVVEVRSEIARILAAQVAPGKRRAILVEEVNGESAHLSAMAALLAESGFLRTNQGYLKRI